MNTLYNSSQEELVEELTESGVLKTPALIDAFRTIDRKDFVSPGYAQEAYENYPLPIGAGQTISQPYTVAFMLELLQPKAGQTIMDVGAGSFWQTAMLAHVVGEHGKVYAIERIPELVAKGKENLAKYDFLKEGRVEVRQENAQNGILESAPFDRIIAAAAAEELPRAWKEQLAVGGRIVAPIKDTITCYTKNEDGTFSEEVHHGFAFVPFVTD